MKVSRNSIWDEFHTFPERYQYESTDICTYTRSVIGGILVALIFVFLGSTISIFVLSPYFVGIMTMITGVFLPEIGGDNSLFIISVAVQLAAVIWIALHYLWILITKNREDRPPSFVKIRYRAFKEKTCFLVERV